jgi:penicillin-binding protein 1A
VQYAKNMGIGDVPSVPSLALGSGEVTVQAMTAAYSAFANHGLVPTPMLIRRVEDRDGRVLFSQQPSNSRAISDTTAFLMATMLADVINAGTGARARRVGFTLPAAGKTGTTNDFNDAWFVGFTPRLATGVWVGFDMPKTILPNGFAAEVAVPLWAKFMKAATDGNTPDWYTPPAGIVAVSVCRLSGKLPTAECVGEETVDRNGNTIRPPSVYTEYFVAGTQPTTYCDAHTSSSPGFFGRIASVFTGSAERPAPPPAVLPPPPAPPPLPRTSAPAPGAMPDSTLGTSLGTALGTVGQSEKPQLQRKSRRGFWSRLFVGDDDNKSGSEDQQPQKNRR